MKNIIVVEDNPEIREILEIFLISENYNVLSFASINDFRKRDLLSIPDLMLFDVMLPDGSGLDLCIEIKQDPNYQNTPIIIMSAHAKSDNLPTDCRPDDFILKPFDLYDLVKRIKRLTT